MPAENRQMLALIEPELKEVKVRYGHLLDNHIPILKEVTDYITDNRGKGLRPILVLLSAKVFGQISDQVIDTAVIIESIHNASLIHDDIIDEAETRRGSPSVNSLLGPKLAVLIGDYLLMRGFKLSIAGKNTKIQTYCTEAVQRLIEGEFIQSDASDKLDNTQEKYFDIIRRKTAVMFSISARAGAELAGATPSQTEALAEFGEIVGILFQLQDDLFDYLPDVHTGKPVGNDLKEKKITLPLLRVLSVCEAHEKEEILSKITSQDEDLLETVRRYVEKYNAIEYVRAVMTEYRGKAFSVLEEVPRNEASDILRNMVDYLIQRDS